MHHLYDLFLDGSKVWPSIGYKVHMQDTGVAARGNATSFLMPWQSILAGLRRLEKKEKRSEAVDLPLSGEDLRSVVQVLLKCNDSAQKKNLPKFIH